MEDTHRYTKSLPADIETNILLRLPAKTLARFKCVSKCWLTVITSQRFIMLYYQRSGNTDGSNLFLIVGKSTIFVCDFPGSEVVAKLPAPPISLKTACILGSSNGLLILLCVQHPTFPYENIMLYNPTTQACKFLPAVKPERCSIKFITTGFGYDHKSGEFKIVSLQDKPYIYRSRSNLWELIKLGTFEKSYSLLITYGTKGSFAVSNNALHWQNYAASIVAFDLGTEKFYEVALPERILDCSEFIVWELAVLRGCLHLALIAMDTSPYSTFPTSAEIWIMKEYGVKESWTKLLQYSSTEVEDLFACHCSPPIKITSNIGCWQVFAYSKDGREILVSFRSLSSNTFSCDLQTREVKKVEALCNLLGDEDNELCAIVPWTCLRAGDNLV